MAHKFTFTFVLLLQMDYWKRIFMLFMIICR